MSVIRLVETKKHSIPAKLKEEVWRDPNYDQASRLAWRWTELSWRSDLVTMGRRKMTMEMGEAMSCLISGAIRTVVQEWKLFRWDARSRAYRRAYLRGENTDAFKLRAQRAVHTKVGLAWVLCDLTQMGPAPHSLADFAEQLGRSPARCSVWLNKVIEDGYFRRYGGTRDGKKSYFTSGSDAAADLNLENQYGIHHH